MSGPPGTMERMFSWKRMSLLLVGLFVLHSCFVYLWPTNLPAAVVPVAPVAEVEKHIPSGPVQNIPNFDGKVDDSVQKVPEEHHDGSYGLISEGNHNLPSNAAMQDASNEANQDTNKNTNNPFTAPTDASNDATILIPEHTNNDSLPTFPEPGLAPQLHIPLDAHNQIIDMLTMDQCEQAFPGLFTDLDSTAHYWQLRLHEINAKDVDIKWRPEPGGALRFLIHDNQIRIVESRGASAMGYRDRGIGLLRIMNRALESASRAGEILPTIEASMILQDVSEPPTPDGTHSFWTFTRRDGDESHRRIWIAPNWDLQGWYHERKRTGISMDRPFKEKIQKLGWRGNPFWNAEIRNTLVDLTKGKPWADVAGVGMGSNDNRLPVDKFCEFAMNIHTEGVSYSDRLEYLLNCNSLTFVHDLKWTTHFSHLLKRDGPDQNVVFVKRDFSDLEEKVTYYLNHPEEAEKIIANAVKDFRRNYLSRAATSCYTRRLIAKYSEVSYTPEVNLPAKPGHVAKRRGVAYEDYVSMYREITDETRDASDYMFGLVDEEAPKVSDN